MLDDYARFRAVTEQQRKGWPAGPSGFVTGNSFFGLRRGHKNYHLYAQWTIQEQLRRCPKKLVAAGRCFISISPGA